VPQLETGLSLSCFTPEIHRMGMAEREQGFSSLALPIAELSSRYIEHSN
jgi:hypothetical protein